MSLRDDPQFGGLTRKQRDHEERIRRLEQRLYSLAPVVTTGDHGGLTGLGDDDHPLYETTAEVAAQVATHAALPDVHHLELVAEDEGVELGRTSRINVVGSGIAATWLAGELTITHTAAAGSAHVIQEDGTPLTDRANLDFRNGLLAIDGGAGPDSSIVDADLEIFDEGISQGTVYEFDFVGTSISVAVAAGRATVTATGGGGSGDVLTPAFAGF